MRCLFAAVALLLPAVATWADGPSDNIPDQVRRIPKLGIDVPESDRQALQTGLDDLASAISRLAALNDAWVNELLPDVRIFHKAVNDALVHREFFAPEELKKAAGLLDIGTKRAAELAAKTASWTDDTGLVVRGYVSKIDGSVQPYGLVIPDSYSPRGGRVRLDLWFHGRGETLSEVNFLDQRRRQAGEITPADTIVLHPYGRYCNAFRFAGEVDVYEALESVRRRYRIDDDRIAARGFSMGGAACWQFAVHDASRWFAATPGAGFAETANFLATFQKETLNPTWFERRLWHLYDCTDYAANLLHCPTIAYSGALDTQKQAADIMVAALGDLGIDLVHLIGPGTRHSYHPETKLEIEHRVSSLAARGRQVLPRTVAFVTYSLKYNRMAWVQIDGLGEHWARASVQAQIAGDSRVVVKTQNVTALTLAMPPGWCPLDPTQPVTVEIDGVGGLGPRPMSDRSWTCPMVRTRNGWTFGSPATEGLRKVHDLQGPIDDAFMDSFLFVRPTGESKNPKVAAWAQAEMQRAIDHWRRQFRGDVKIKDDTAVTKEDIAAANLVLWGDPASNASMARVAANLPISWQTDRITAGDRSLPSADHALILIYPNPYNPKRYVVFNSGFTYRDYDYLNNARQTPKLPDWAIIDVNTPPNARWPGKVVAADFFGEAWELTPPRDH